VAVYHHVGIPGENNTVIIVQYVQCHSSALSVSTGHLSQPSVDDIVRPSAVHAHAGGPGPSPHTLPLTTYPLPLAPCPVPGVQQVSTFGGNLVATTSYGQVLFMLMLVALGLFLFALLIGNMQNFLQGLSRR